MPNTSKILFRAFLETCQSPGDDFFSVTAQQPVE